MQSIKLFPITDLSGAAASAEPASNSNISRQLGHHSVSSADAFKAIGNYGGEASSGIFMTLRSGRKVWHSENGLDHATDQLHQLIRNGSGDKTNIEQIRALMAQGNVYLDRKDNNGNAAIYYAGVERKNAHIVAILMEHNAYLEDVRDSMNENDVMLEASNILEKIAFRATLRDFFQVLANLLGSRQ